MLNIFNIKILIVLLTVTCSAYAETTSNSETERLLNMPFEELLELEIEVAAKTSQKQSEAPSIVTVVSREQLSLFGVRDLADILRIVPGFEFGLDVGSIAGLFFRGTWAHEGKALIMVDNIPINDHAFGNNNFLGNIPFNSIDKVEIVRGPGSALYGGFAEVAVINVVTSKGKNLDGVRVQADAGILGDDVITRNASVSAGYSKDDFDISLHIGTGKNAMSNKENNVFISIDSGLYSVKSPYSQGMDIDNSYRQPFYVFINTAYKNLKLGFVRNEFRYSAQNTWFIRPQVHNQYLADYNFTVTGARAEYTQIISKDAILMPSIEYTTSTMIGSRINPSVTDGGMYRNEFTDMYRTKGELSAKLLGELLLGIGYMRDDLEAIGMDGRMGLQLSADAADTARTTYTDSKYAYFQYEKKVYDLKVTLGLRYENTSFGDALAPRLGLVYDLDPVAIKLLYGRSYRVPTPYQTFSRSVSFPNSMPKPETANSYEMELDWRINPNMVARTNAFLITIDEPISYLGKTDSYQNYGEINSMGLEGSLKVFYDSWGGYFTFGYTKPSGNTSAIMKSADGSSFLGFPELKITAAVYYSFGFMSISPSITLLSKRAGITREYAEAVWKAADATTIPLETQYYPAIAMLNFNILIPEVLSGVNLRLTGYNLTNSHYKLIQAYYDVGAPLPANDRHLILSLEYNYR